MILLLSTMLSFELNAVTAVNLLHIATTRSGPAIKKNIAPGVEHCVRTLNGLLGHPQQSSLRPFPHKRGRKLWGLPLVTHRGSDPCQIHVWESFSEIIVVWHSHPFSSSSSVLAIGASLIENLRPPRSGTSVLVVRLLVLMMKSRK
jgi:hypothetical protein